MRTAWARALAQTWAYASPERKEELFAATLDILDELEVMFEERSLLSPPEPLPLPSPRKETRERDE